MRMNRIIPLLAAPLALSLFIPHIEGNQVEAKNDHILFEANKEDVYSYSLLGKTYLFKEGITSASLPNGEKISIDDGQIYLEYTNGMYTFEYETYTEHLKIYEAKPQDKITYSFLIPESISIGETLSLPTASIYSGIVRSDKLIPEVGQYSDYRIEIKKGQKTLKTMSGEAASISFDDAGTYEIDYVYHDVFDDDMAFVSTIEVKDMPTIILDGVLEECDLYETLDVSDAYGYYHSTKYQLSTSYVSPTGKEGNFSRSLLLNEEGTWTIQLTSQIEGQEIKKTHTINVNKGAKSLFTKRNSISSLTNNDDFPSNIVDTSGDPLKGLSFTATKANASFYWNKIVDLNEVEGSLIEFVPNFKDATADIKEAKLTLTDAFDESNSISVLFITQPEAYNYAKGHPYHSNIAEMKGVYKNTSYGETYDSVGNQLISNGKITSYGFTPAWGQTMAPNIDPDAIKIPVNVSYSLVDNCFYTETAPGVKVMMANMGSKKFGFPGFKSSKVYLNFEITNGQGDVIIHSFGGKDLTNIEASDFVTNENLLFVSDSSELQKGAVNYPYTVVSPYSNSLLFGTLKSSLSMTKDGVDVTSLLDANNSFTPTEKGTYQIAYRMKNQFGNDIEAVRSFEILESPIDIQISTSLPSSVKMQDTLVIKEPSFTGGIGDISYTMTIDENGEKTQIEAPFAKKITKKGSFTVTITAIDSIGYEVSKDFVVNVDSSFVYFYMDDMPKAVETNQEFSLPTPTIYDYREDENSDSYAPSPKIYVDGSSEAKNANDAISFSEAGTHSIVYEAAGEKRTYELKVKDKFDKDNPGNFFDTNSYVTSVSTEEMGMAFGLKAKKNGYKPAITLPYALSMNSFNFEVSLNTSSMSKITKIEVKLESFDGKTLSIGVSRAGSTRYTPTYLLNGEDTEIEASYSETNGFRTIFFQFDHAYKTVYNNVSSKQFDVAYWDDGTPFEGFLRSGAYVTIEATMDKGNSIIYLSQISNQTLATGTLKNGDMIAPMLGTSFVYKPFVYCKTGERYSFKKGYAYDVFQSQSIVSMAMYQAGTDYKGTYGESVDADITFSVIGSFVIRFKTTDSLNKSAVYSYVYSVCDNEAPTATFPEGYKGEYNVNEEISIVKPTISDDHDSENDINVVVSVLLPNGSYISLEQDDSGWYKPYTPKEKGRYVFVYYVTDSAENASTYRFSFIAK